MTMIGSVKSTAPLIEPSEAPPAPVEAEDDNASSSGASSIPTTMSEDATETSFENMQCLPQFVETPIHHYHSYAFGRGLERQSSSSSSSYSRTPRSKDGRKLFVGGLPHNVTNKEFRSFFKEYGAILDSVVLMEKEHKRPRGFGFVKFQDLEVAQKVLALSKEKAGLRMRGKRIDLKVAEPKEVPEKHVTAAPALGHGYYVATPSYTTQMMIHPESLENEETSPAAFFAYPYVTPAFPVPLYDYNMPIQMYPHYYDAMMVAYESMMVAYDPAIDPYYSYPMPATIDPSNATPTSSPDPTALQS